MNFFMPARALAFAALVTAAMSGTALAQTSLSFLIDNSPASIAITEGLVAEFTAANPDITIDVEIRPDGTEGDNLIKTRLATQSMPDLFLYNGGSLLQAINPGQYLVDLKDEPWQADVQAVFKSVVTVDESVYGAPYRTAMGGGIFYNKKVYEELGLEVPKTWADFMANNAAIKEAGIAPVIQTYNTNWTAQMLTLGDYYNIQAQVPDFAERYTAGEAKFATTPAALASFKKLEEIRDAGYLNADFGSATYVDGLRMLAEGTGAHYPSLTVSIGALKANFPDALNDIGFFAVPGESADQNGLTAWMPLALYIPNTTQNLDAAKRFVAFVASEEGCASETKAVGATGPYLIAGCSLPADVPPAVADLDAYFAEGGHFAPALEFVSPVKGPYLAQFLIEVGSGIRSADEAAALYDEDVKKQAQQLGLPGW